MEACAWSSIFVLFTLCLAANQQQVYPNETKPASEKGKGMSSCNIIYDSQMLIIGGIPGNFQELACDSPDIKGQHGLLLGGDVAWRNLNQSIESYMVPDVLTSVIGGGYVSLSWSLRSVLTMR